jgi:hypothetical protein
VAFGQVVDLIDKAEERKMNFPNTWAAVTPQPSFYEWHRIWNEGH